MRTRLFAILAVSVVSVGLAAVPSSGAKAPTTATFKVVYLGGGQWQRGATLTTPCDASSSVERSAFHWTITWSKVTLKLTGKVATAVVGKPRGKLEVDNSNDFTDTPKCGGEALPACHSSHDEHTADEAPFGFLAMTRHGSTLRIIPDADASPNGTGKCPSNATDEADQKLLYLGNYGPSRSGGKPSPLMAINAKLPLTRALHTTHKINVRDGVLNKPGASFDCSLGSPYVACREGQSWSGRIEVTRLK
jgi:hypothetical protein